MGFFIECRRGAEIVQAGQAATISADRIKQDVENTTQVSAKVSKNDDELRRATFVSTAPQGKFTWHVFFSTGDGDAYIEDVVLASAPSDVVVQSNPEFKVRDSDS